MSYDFQGKSRPRIPQTGTGANLFDEFKRDGVEYCSEDAVHIIPFGVPGASAPFSIFASKSDDDGRIAERQIAFDNFVQNQKYEYDAEGRLNKVWSGERLIEEYLYGEFGERYFAATMRKPQRTFRYGPGLRLEQGGKVKYSYDQQGRLVMKQDGTDVTTYDYHYSGQLEQVELPDGRCIAYTIDPEGRRIAKSINGKVVESYMWHDFITLAAVEDNYGNCKEFAYDEDGDPIAMRFNESVYYFAADQVGTVYIVANAEGNEVKRIIRDSFGNKIIDTNERMDISLGFAAGLHDKDTGLVHFGFREYDPSIGRFIQPDPLGLAGGDVDIYGYCADDPVNFIDRGGLQDESEKGDSGTNGGGAKSESLGGKSESLGDSSRSELGGWDGLSGYAGPSFSEYVGNDVDLDGSSFSGGLWGGGPDGSPGGGDAHPGPKNTGQNAKANAEYAQGQQKALDTLNQSGAQAGKKADALAGELAQKQAQFDASLQAKRDRKAVEDAQRDRQRRASLINKNDEEENKGFFAKVADATEEAMAESWKAAGKAVAKTIDTLQGDEKHEMKFAGYVTDKKKSMYDTMMKGAKETVIDGAKDGVAKYGPAGVALGMASGAYGMLENLGKAIQDNYEYDAYKNQIEQRQHVKGDYFSQMKNSKKR